MSKQCNYFRVPPYRLSLFWVAVAFTQKLCGVELGCWVVLEEAGGQCPPVPHDAHQQMRLMGPYNQGAIKQKGDWLFLPL